MAMQQTQTVVGVFNNHADAQKAIRALKDAGFREDQIGVATSNQGGEIRRADEGEKESYAAEGAAAGLVAGAGLCALLARTLENIAAVDAVTTGAAIAILIAVALAAAGLPALRVRRVQPADVLRG